MSSYDREWLKRHCKEKESLAYSLRIRCAYCDKVFRKNEKNYTRYFIKHLYEYHGLTELDGHSKCDELKEKFEIMENQHYVGVCKEQLCEVKIIFFRGVYLLQNHLQIFHGNRSHIYINAIRHNTIGDTLLHNYFIMDNNTAQCLICKDVKSLTDLESKTGETLQKLKSHWAEHFEQKQNKEEAEQLRVEMLIEYSRERKERQENRERDENTQQLDEIYRLERVQQRIDRMDFLEELDQVPLMDVEAEEIGNYFDNLLTETEEVDNFEKMIEEVIDRIEQVKLFKTLETWKITNSEGICIRCFKKVMYDDGIHIMKNHWELYHGQNSHIYKEIIDIKIVCDILDQYIIMENKLVCTSLNCTDSFEVKALRSNIEEQLVILLKHWHTHIGTPSDDQIKQEEHLREEFRQKKNKEEEQLVYMLENSGRKDRQESRERDENTPELQLDELHSQEQQRLYEQYIKQIMEQEANNLETQEDTVHKEKEKDLKEVDELLKKYYIESVQEEDKLKVKCLKCDKFVNDTIRNERLFYLIRNHFEIYHGKLNYIYERIERMLKGYRITDSIMWCTVCSANLNFEMDVETTNEKVIVLFLHWIDYHSNDKDYKPREELIKILQRKLKQLGDWKMLELYEKQKRENITISVEGESVENQEEHDDSGSSILIDVGTLLLEQSGPSTSRDAGTVSPEQSESSTSTGAMTDNEPPEQSELSIWIRLIPLPTRRSGSQSTPAQNSSSSDSSSNESPPSKQRKDSDS